MQALLNEISVYSTKSFSPLQAKTNKKKESYAAQS